MTDQYFDDLAMTGMRGQHESGLPMAVAGIHIGTPVKHIANVLDVTTLDRIFPNGIHQSNIQPHPPRGAAITNPILRMECG